MYYSTAYFRELAPRIRMSAQMLETLEALMPRLSPEEADSLARYIADPASPDAEKRERMTALSERENGELLCVLVYMTAAGYTHEIYKEKGLPDEVFYDTFNCLPEKMETCRKFTGKWGYPSILWPLYHVHLTRFRIGRLTYDMQTVPDDLISRDYLPFQKGDQVLKIHISDNESLAGCAESMRSARAFFTRYYPEYKNAVMLTRTWLLDPRLTALLSPDSNIIKFQQLFHIYDYINNEQEVLRRIFGEYKENLDAYTPTSSLARAVLPYLKAGNRLGSGLGYVPTL